MELPAQKRGVLLFFPQREGTTTKLANESCPECKRLERAYGAAIEAIQLALRAPTNISERLSVMYRKQDERDRILVELYEHRANAHPKRAGVREVG